MQFYKMNKEDSVNMAAHVNKFNAIKQQLMSVKRQIFDDEAIFVLLNSVDKEPYCLLVSTLQNVDKTLQEVEAALLEFETKHKGIIETTSSAAQIFYSRGQGYATRGRGVRGRGRGGQGQGQFLCHNCGKP